LLQGDDNVLLGDGQFAVVEGRMLTWRKAEVIRGNQRRENLKERRNIQYRRSNR
jgi:hypothetical protein